MANEIELKLEAGVEALDLIERSDLLVGEGERVDQHATYFDTPDQALRKAGLALRIRSSGGSRVQTIKASSGRAAGLFARGEWERPVEGDQPVLDETTPIRSAIGDRTEELEPIFEVRVERRIWNVQQGDASIELVIDRGEVTAADRSAPIVEIELELKSGSASDLFALARRIDAIAPVKSGVLTKSERGYRLLDAARTAFKAEPVSLDDEATAAEAFQHIVHACLRQFRLNEAMLFPDRHVDALHQARVAIRRMRSAFTIFRKVTSGKEADRLREELRWLSGELGEARNLDVLLGHTQPGLAHDRIAAARERAYDEVERALAAPRARSLMLDLLTWTSTGDWLDLEATEEDRRQPARDYAVDALDRFRRKVKKDGRNLADADDEARHTVRKDAKKLRYASEFFRLLFARKRERRRYKNFTASLEHLQDKLGALNDIATAPIVLKELDLEDEAPMDLEAKKDLIAAASDAQQDLVDAKRFWN